MTQPPYPAPEGYELFLADADAIADHIEECSPTEVDHEFIYEALRGYGAVLKFVPMGEISLGNVDANVAVASKEKKYKKLPLESMPPIFLEEGEVTDGNHRYRVALAKGAIGMWAYVATEEEVVADLIAGANEVENTPQSSTQNRLRM
jgi:hypothetical protein